jgi:hypothetical protein
LHKLQHVHSGIAGRRFHHFLFSLLIAWRIPAIPSEWSAKCCAVQSSLHNHSSRRRDFELCLHRLWYVHTSTLTSGTQNYSCNPATSTYYTNGTAEAKLFDVTSLYTGSTPPAVYPPLASLQPAVDHFYVPNPNAPTTVIPRFQLCNPGQFFEGTKNSTVANAVPSYSVAAVLLQKVQGTLADWVVRTNVIGGVVPAALNTCSAGENIAIPYKANYLFFSK